MSKSSAPSTRPAKSRSGNSISPADLQRMHQGGGGLKLLPREA
eukprot:CAMPEP_0185623352 /NCGR_PEP_ID=MMETSP0436-20130131/59815_1 /TAXON_ID=626734 ORGANISM="Favella taraikaensis, Strain Fe Narragansett Bay" /NCGR_SAMPLE_ID=MMETSP0436 /ASSEMBLY_ACC=CAM_ASM_000390 /LENGTH=42 /DNA_ID= /DNA_START= /DNA_END= /DNA_ORIENTATION=